MSIRRTIDELVGDPDGQTTFRNDPQAFFAEHGMAEMPQELIGSAFVHFSDSAPIEHADAVAGIATHYSPIPFEPSDLAEAGDVADGDPFSSLQLIAVDVVDDVPVDHDLDDANDDPSDDATPDESSADDATDDATDADGDDGTTSSGEFGDGHDAATADLGDDVATDMDPEDDDPFFDAVTDADTGIPEVAIMTTVLDEELPSDQPVSDYGEFVDDSVVAEFDDVDPSDLDLDDLTQP